MDGLARAGPQARRAQSRDRLRFVGSSLANSTDPRQEITDKVTFVRISPIR